MSGTLVVLSAVVALLLTRTAWRNTVELLDIQAELAITLIEQEIRDYVTPALEISRFIHDQVATGQVNPKDTDALRNLFTGALAAAPQISGVALWDENRTKMEIRRAAHGLVVVNNQQDPDTPELRAFLDAVRAHGKPLWGPPSEGDAEANYIYTATPLYYRQHYWGVMVAGLTVNDLSYILARISEQSGMTAFILYDGDVLAHPALVDAPSVRGSDNLARLLRISELGDPIISQYYDSEITRPRSGNFELRYIPDPSGAEYLVLSRLNYEFGGDAAWRIGIYAPVTTWDKQVRRLINVAIGGGLVLLFAILVALLLARKIAAPVRALTTSAEQISELKLNHHQALPRSGIKELDQQADSFEGMVEGLRWFEKYVPQKLVRQLMRGAASVTRSREAELSVLFTDIIGFTALSETMRPAQVGKLLNQHFELIARCIEREGGTLDKYNGDAVMAFWGAPEAQPDHATRACRAALAIADGLAKASHAPALRIKMAIHSGPLLVGNIGAASRMNYTVIGDTVNTCSRIESLCGQFDDGAPAIILVSQATAKRVGNHPNLRFTQVGGHRVKGRSDTVHVCKLTPQPDAAPPKTPTDR